MILRRYSNESCWTAGGTAFKLTNQEHCILTLFKGLFIVEDYFKSPLLKITLKTWNFFYGQSCEGRTNRHFMRENLIHQYYLFLS